MRMETRCTPCCIIYQMSIILTIGLPSNQDFLNKQKEDICVDDELYCKQETAPLQFEKHKWLHCLTLYHVYIFVLFSLQ